MTILRRFVIGLFAGFLLVACGSSSKPATSTAVTAPGESPPLARLAQNPPRGYEFVDASKEEIENIVMFLMMQGFTADEEDQARGVSAHSVVRKSDNRTIAEMILMEVPPRYVNNPSAEQQLIDDLTQSAGGVGVHQVTLKKKTWWTSSVPDGQESYLYADLQGKVVISLLGPERSHIEAFINALRWP